MLTFVGVVFTITLVALQLASAQLSPRVIRTFVRSGITKLAFGLFLATFAYAIIVIVVEGASSRASVRRLAVTLGVLFVLASLVVFVVYVTATMRLLQVSWVVTVVADETRRVLARERPVAASYLTAPAPQLDQDPRVVRLKAERNDGSGGEFGVILGVDRGRLVQLGQQYDCLLQLLPKVGEYLPIGASLVAVHRGAGPPDDTVRGCVHLGRSRTMYQDPLFGLRQLVDVASQALSPAINQPTTAVVVIDRLEELLLRIARRPQPTGFFVDTDGVLRLMHPEPTWAETVDLAFTEVTIYGASSPTVIRRGPRPTTGCSARSPSTCVLTSLGIALSWSLLPPERSSPTIPWLLLGRIREDLADDTARCRSGQAMRNRSLATSRWSRYGLDVTGFVTGARNG